MLRGRATGVDDYAHVIQQSGSRGGPPLALTLWNTQQWVSRHITVIEKRQVWVPVLTATSQTVLKPMVSGYPDWPVPLSAFIQQPGSWDAAKMVNGKLFFVSSSIHSIWQERSLEERSLFYPNFGVETIKDQWMVLHRASRTAADHVPKVIFIQSCRWLEMTGF